MATAQVPHEVMRLEAQILGLATLACWPLSSALEM
jgi:hypothetical protein